MLSVRGLRKSYGERVAVDGLSLDVRSGEAFGFLGPNGAGKSTTIACMTGLLTPDEGEVLLDGASPADPDVRRGLGVAPQSLALYPELTADENLRYFGRLHGLAGRRLDDRVDWALALAGLADRRHDRVGAYSGGMQRRLNLACALIHEPKLVLLDEPTVGIDPQSRHHVFETIDGLRRAGLTIVYTSHHMEEVERLCDRIAIIDHGKLLACDTLPNLLALRPGAADLEAVFLDLTGRSLRDA